MAEINMQAASSRRTGKRLIKRSIVRVDLTPMVDLGFLLITFFILTTSWSEPRAMLLKMPANGPASMIGQNAVLTAIALDHDKVFYYHGSLEEALKNGSYGITGYSPAGGIGDIICSKQQAMDHSYKGGRGELMFIIKSAREASYKNIVALLDETLINQVKRYAVVDFTDEEKKRIDAQQGR